MSVRFTFRGMPAEKHVRDFGRRCLHYALARFAGDLRGIDVVLEDCNGEKGGIDKRCRIQVSLVDGRQLQAVVLDSSSESALHRAAGRLRRQFQAAVGERNQRKSERRAARAGLALGRVSVTG